MKILFVCLGNICRSPLAEGILKHINPNIKVDSAGTSNYHIGSPPDIRMIETAQSYGIDISNLAARQFVTKISIALIKFLLWMMKTIKMLSL